MKCSYLRVIHGLLRRNALLDVIFIITCLCLCTFDLVGAWIGGGFQVPTYWKVMKKNNDARNGDNGELMLKSAIVDSEHPMDGNFSTIIRVVF